MSLVARLMEFVSDVVGPREAAASAPHEHDERLAAAALLVHVARVDGGLRDDERAALSTMLSDRFAMAAVDVERLIAEADRLDREVDDIADLVDMIGHEQDAQDRRRLLTMAYRLAAADGVVQEFEEDLVWRMGRLLGFDQREIDAIRTGAVELDPAGRVLRG